VRVAVILGGTGEESLQQVLLVFIQQRVTPPAGLVLKGCGIVVLGVEFDPVVDGLPGDAEHAGDVGGGATMVEFQDGQCPAIQAGIPGLCQLTPETSPLPGGQVESAHGLPSIIQAAHEQTACQFIFDGLLSGSLGLRVAILI
jgi:hypothetical protein